MSPVVEHLAELTGYRDRDMLDVTLVGALHDLLHPLCAAVYRCVGDDEQSYWVTRARQRDTDRVASADPLWAELASLPRIDDEPLRAACLRSGEVRSGDGGRKAVLPLHNDREVVGVVEIDTQEPLAPEALTLVSGILRVYRNFQALLDYSERDTLTGLLNRKTFDDTFLRSTTPAPAGTGGDATGNRRNSAATRVWLGLIDIDHFKAVNDNFGHLIGDEVLLLLSRLMRGCFRWHDQLYRFGGEEFVVLLRAAEADHAAAAFERLRAAVQDYAFPQVGQITVSAGFTEVMPGDTPSSAFDRADKSVYHAKEHGRNQVASHLDLVARGIFAEIRRDSDVELF
jgi:diguanylate cyclase (GGDEF)-like protein